MIVRINQIDAARADMESGWPVRGPAGPLRSQAMTMERAFELLILEQDEQNRLLPDPFRRAQLRQMVPLAIDALREPGEEVVVRLDGPLTDGQLLPVLRWLTEPDGQGRYVLSDVRKMDDAPGDPPASLRLHVSAQRLLALCTDPAVGVDRAVRLRVFCVPEPMVEPLLEIDTPDAAMWDEVLPYVGLMLGATTGMRSLQILTSRFDAPAVKSRVMQRLIASASMGMAAV